MALTTAIVAEVVSAHMPALKGQLEAILADLPE